MFCGKIQLKDIEVMQHAIEAIIAQTEGDMQTTQKEPDASIEHSLGIQKYMHLRYMENL